MLRLPFKARKIFRCPISHGLVILIACCVVLASMHAQASATSLVEKLKQHQTSLRCEDMKVALLLRAIGRQADVNIFVSDDIKETITLDMEGLSLYEAFKIITDAKQLSYVEKNNIIMVAKLSTAEGGLKNFRTERLCTEYGNAGNYVGQLKPLLSANGKLTVSNRGDCLIVQDLPTQIKYIAQMLAELDQPVPQVYIEAKIITISDEAKRQLGIKWDYDYQSTKNPLNIEAGVGAVEPTTTATIGFIRSYELYIDIEALEEDNQLKVLSSPRILVIDGKEAEIKSGQEVPYSTGTADSLSTSFREATLSLKVTPKIIKNNYIILDVTVNNDSVAEQTVTGGTATGEQPLINTQEISSNLFLENKETVVIGGIFQERLGEASSGVPILSKIPILGWLFKSRGKVKERRELLVIITPTIVDFHTANKINTGGETIRFESELDKIDQLK